MDINSTLLMGLVLLDEEAQDDRIRRKIRAARHRLFMKRQKEGCFQILVMKHLKDNNTKFIEYFRVNQEQFKHIVELVRGYIIKLPSKRYPKPISPEEKVAVTLRFLATGEAMRSLAFQFRISHNYMSLIIKTTLKAMCKSLVPIYLPSITTNILKQSAEGFLSKWNFPCCAAIDGKHVRIRNIPNSGSLYYNYKNYFSIVLLAVTDPDCKFLCVDIGSYGKESDSGIFAKSTIGKQILNGTFPFPSDIKLPGTDIFLPQFIVGDGGFKLTPRLMKPYPFVQSQEDTEKRHFNYRLSRARRTVESAFGILANVFRIFHSPIHMDPGTIDYLILAACCLHNMLINNKCASSNNCSDSDIPIPCENFRSLRRAGGTEITSAVNIRNELKSYGPVLCSQQGRLTWQDNY